MFTDFPPYPGKAFKMVYTLDEHIIFYSSLVKGGGILFVDRLCYTALII
jgi:hypothetical protein